MTLTNPFEEIVSLSPNTYKNSTVVTRIGGVGFTLWDTVKASLGCRLNLGLLGGSGEGKSQLVSDIQGLFGNNADKVLGRNDLDIKSLYRELDFGQLKEALDTGGKVSQAALSTITGNISKPLVVVEEINRCVEAIQNQFFNIFEGFIEIDGTSYALGGSTLETFRGLAGEEWQRNIRYSVGVWTANLGNGEYTGTVSMDKALKERSHLMIDVDNFSLQAPDLDSILLGSGGEIRLKDHEGAQDHTEKFAKAFASMAQSSYTPDPIELGQELLLFRYLVLGLDYIPHENANNSKKAMKEVWPALAEEKGIGSGDEKYLYRMVASASVRSAMTIMSFARGLRQYARAKDTTAKPTVLESVTESFKLVGAYSGMLRNPQRIREEFVGNPYRAATKVADVLEARLSVKQDVMDAIIYSKAEKRPLTRAIKNECTADFACFVS